jgi:L-aminopeptidase/D-esterase-like protein
VLLDRVGPGDRRRAIGLGSALVVTPVRTHDLGVAGVRVGHWTDREARTGCTVIRFPEGTVASGEVRGGAPATREVALLDPSRLVERIDALVLSGGSAFGLAAGDGAMAALADEGVGFETGAGPVPIVVGLSLFDLLVGDGSVRPGPAEGRLATESAAEGPIVIGSVGAGTGATVGKWRGREHARPGGLGAATEHDGELVVAALVAVNAFGDIDPGGPLAGRLHPLPPARPVGVGADPPLSGAEPESAAFGNTTIALVVTNARLTKLECHLVAQSAHDGFGRALVPAHTRVDGDAVVAAATGSLEVEVPADRVRLLAVAAVEAAIRAAAP